HSLPAEFFLSSRRRHTRFSRDWSSDVCSSDLQTKKGADRLPSSFQTITGSALVDRHVGLVFRTVVVGARANDLAVLALLDHVRRSEERRVGKEWRSRFMPCGAGGRQDLGGENL